MSNPNMNLSGDTIAEIHTTTDQLPISIMEKLAHTVWLKKMFNLMNKLNTNHSGDTILVTHTTMVQQLISIMEKLPHTVSLKKNEIWFFKIKCS